MPVAAWIALVPALLLVLGLLSRKLLDNPRGDVETGVYLSVSRAYAALFHRMRVVGTEHLPRQRHPGPLIVIANHASGVDPVLIQAACPFEVRWLMAQDMRHPAGEAFWRWANVIFVGEGPAGAAGTREALRHLKAGRVLGIFPEGGIERPPRMVRPFLPGVGYIVKRSGAPVLPIVLTGLPEVDPAWSALWTPSRAVVTFKAPIDYARTRLSPAEIVDDLRRRYMDWTGWPANDAGGPHEAGVPGDAPRPMPFPRAGEPRPRRVAGA